MRLLIISDIHAESASFAVPLAESAVTSRTQRSWVRYGTTSGSSQQNSLDRLLEALTSRKENADVVVCPGDICDRADGDGLQLAWKDLHRIRDAVGATEVLATAGNHDIDSRFRSHEYDPKRALQRLSPLMPIADQAKSDQYWARAFAPRMIGSTLFLTVNSCVAHIYRNNSLERGHIPEDLIGEIDGAIQQHDGQYTSGVLLLHHHPLPFALHRSSQDDRAFGGERLLHTLTSSSADWLVIHGHCHLSHVWYAAGGSSSSPVILSAASAGMLLDPIHFTDVSNQIHFVDLDGGVDGTTGVSGTVETFDYTQARGWEPAPRREAGLPFRTGFGARARSRELSSAVATAVRDAGGIAKWTDLLAQVPLLKYLTPEDHSTFERLLRTEHSLDVVWVKTTPLHVAEISS